MAFSRGLLFSLGLIGLGCVGYLQFGERMATLGAWGTVASQRPIARPAPEGFTEEQWTVMEVCDQIVFLLHPELLKQPAGENRITAQRNRSTPVSYTVEGGQAKSTVTLSAPVWDPATYQVWCKAVSRQTPGTAVAPRRNIL